MTINKNAGLVGIIEWVESRNRVAIYLGTNSNTGEDILWQSVNGKKATRLTGRNIDRLAAELNAALNEGEAVWIERNDTLVDILAARLN